MGGNTKNMATYATKSDRTVSEGRTNSVRRSTESNGNLEAQKASIYLVCEHGQVAIGEVRDPPFWGKGLVGYHEALGRSHEMWVDRAEF